MKPIGPQKIPKEPGKPYAWLADLPTTQLRILVTLTIVLATALRFLFMADAPDMTGWLTFLGALAGIDTATVVGKRLTTDPAVITAEAAARQDPPPDVLIDPAGGMAITPQVGAVQEPPPARGEGA